MDLVNQHSRASAPACPGCCAEWSRTTHPRARKLQLMPSPAGPPIGVPYLGRTELTQYFGHLAGQSSRGSELTSRAAPPWLSLRSSAWQSAVARLGCRQLPSTAHQAPPRWTITASTPLAHRLSRADGHLSGTGSRHKPAPPARNRRRGSGTVARRARGRPRRAAPACTSRGRVARSQLKLAWSPPPACCVTQSAYVLRVVHPHCVAECAGQRRILVEPSLLLDRPGRASPVQPRVAWPG